MKDFATKKTRTDAWGEDFSEDFKWRLYAYTKPLRDGEEGRPVIKSYEDACEYLVNARLQSGEIITPPSRAGWYRYLSRMRAEENIGRLQGGVAEAEGVAARANISNTALADALKALAADRVFACGDESAGAKLIAAATSLLDRAQKDRDLELKSRAQDLKEDALRIAEERLKLEQAKAASAVKAVEDPSLTDEERVSKIKDIFGIA